MGGIFAAAELDMPWETLTLHCLDGLVSPGQLNQYASVHAVIQQPHPKGGGVPTSFFSLASPRAFTPLEEASMTHRVRTAFGRILVVCAGFAIALALATSSLAAQESQGKVEGTVTDQANAPIANAQVFVVGTSFGAVTNDKGYYFINNVPVGTYSMRAQFIGYAPSEVRAVRVLGGQTLTVPIKMQSSAVVLTGITVTAAANPIVPRDQVTSKAIIAGDLVDHLPVDDVRSVIALTPGVVESGSSAGVSIRGGRPGEANVYIDGAPVRRANSGAARGNLGTNMIEEASVTKGGLGAEISDAPS